ncbi:MAG: histidyl-tRNA synthetase [Actinomycetota bacterium]|jgi:histidyl-tRNA synthetase|nr:histidyl-tRNA synthetase [Actinomycetota bacterium]
MRDFLPAEKARREHVLSIIRRTFREHGFDEIETPVVEDSDRLHAGLGGDNEKLSYAVMKRDLKQDDLQEAATSGDYLDLADLGLRFDLTVPLARFYASHRAELPGVFRSIQIAPVWRAERPQKGRYRQFVQCDIDIIGEAGPLAEIELITATAASLEALGFRGTNASTIRINDRRILRRIVETLGIPDASYERALITIDKEDKIGVPGVVKELVEQGLGEAATLAPILDGLSQLAGDGWELLDAPPAWLDVDAYRDLLAIRDAVDDSARLVFSPNLVRGMGYYTGTIFEVAHPSLPYSLGGGGRYDGMIGRFLGTDVPAAGLSLGFERLVELVELPEDEAANAVALVYDADVAPPQLAALKSELIASGVRTTLARRTKNTTAQLEQLAAAGYPRFAFVAATTVSARELEMRNIGAQ